MTAHIDSMAYMGQTPWHGLGSHLTEKADIDQWKVEAGMTWTAEKGTITYETIDGNDAYFLDETVVLYRSDTHVPLGIVSKGYQTVQPGDVLEFFRDITELGEFEMETAGSLLGGKRLWALARNPHSQNIAGEGDEVRPYLLLATSMDSTMATRATFTTVRVVCQNTLQLALGRNTQGQISVTHRSKFNPQRVKAQLGLIDGEFSNFTTTMRRLAHKKVTPRQTDQFFGRLFDPKFDSLKAEEQIECLDRRQPQLARATYQEFPGQHDIIGTAYGLVNGVTAFVDHTRNTRTADSRLSSAWFGDGANLKARAVEIALDL